MKKAGLVKARERRIVESGFQGRRAEARVVEKLEAEVAESDEIVDAETPVSDWQRDGDGSPGRAANEEEG